VTYDETAFCVCGGPLAGAPGRRTCQYCGDQETEVEVAVRLGDAPPVWMRLSLLLDELRRPEQDS
jgi:hypothetical protein